MYKQRIVLPYHKLLAIRYTATVVPHCQVTERYKGDTVLTNALSTVRVSDHKALYL
jgi:hypothetical protein